MAYAWDDEEDETPPLYPDFMLPELRTFEDQEWGDNASWVGSLILFMSCCGWQYPGHDHAQDYYSDLLYEEDLQLKTARACCISRAGLKERKKRLRMRYGMRRWRRRMVGLVSRRDISLVMNDALLNLDLSISSWTGSCASAAKAFLDNSELTAEVLDRSTCACLSEAPEHCYQHLPMPQEVYLEDLVMPNPKWHQGRHRDFEIIPSLPRVLPLESCPPLSPLSKHTTGRAEDDWSEVDCKEDDGLHPLQRLSYADVVRRS
ncbi:hypothetical protein SISNIDRAFT_485454 [Sistotremastrum niveocremeum HHB9708]|uniref:Uncharacterized protein n=1 Tax=Sistotremastrum niveocremeum HHB9708 TaxID=1314777 RepID=A0A164V669_9AGAM|nr:hypothetical protein SISNIDRAFT_485454 [Sistotremastrum niveocremeum HHB9708]